MSRARRMPRPPSKPPKAAEPKKGSALEDAAKPRQYAFVAEKSVPRRKR